MKHLFIVLLLILVSCGGEEASFSLNPENWKKRRVQNPLSDSLPRGTTYLSVYSQIYGKIENKTFDLTVTVSMRNTSNLDTIYIEKAEFYNTGGDLIRSYFKDPIYLSPLETVEIVIDEIDKEGGTGGNFVFDWITKPNSSEPLFEGVMITTSGQTGLSFTTQGKRIR